MQGEWQGIDLQQLGGIKAGSALLLRRTPEPQAAPRPQPAGPSGPLFGAGQAGGHGDQPIHAALGIKAGAAAQAAIDHQPHPGQGEGAFGDRGGQYHLALGGWGGGNGLALGGQGQVAVEGHTVDRRPPVRGANGPQAGLDFPLARQKHQHGFMVDALVEPVLLQGPQHELVQPFPLPGAQVVHGHRVAAAFALEHLGVRQLGRQGGQIQGGRHHHQPQLGTDQLPGLPNQGQG